MITLTIIGVIAAMTVPTLLMKHQKQTFVVGLKKAYANLTNAMQMLPLENNCPAGDFECAGWNSGDTRTKTELLSRMFKTSGVDLEGTDPKFNSYQAYGTIQRGEDLTLGFQTTDGMVYNIIYARTAAFARIYVDVNGQKGPNRLGRDQFFFVISENDTTNNIQEGTVVPVGSRKASDSVYWRDSNDCTTAKVDRPNSDLVQQGTCTGRVLEEGKMNY